MYTIAIDLGGTVVKIGLLSDGEIVDLSLIHISEPTRP